MFIIESSYFYVEVRDSTSASNSIFKLTNSYSVADRIKLWCEKAEPGDKTEFADIGITVEYVETETEEENTEKITERELLDLMKEKEGLKVGYNKYKRKYKAISNFVHRDLYFKIEGLKVQFVQCSERIARAKTPEEKAQLQNHLRFISQERAELQKLYDLCCELEKFL